VLIGLNFPFDVRNYACGHTPVCKVVNDLVRAGMVAVVPAGNLGYRESSAHEPFQVLYSSITDPAMTNWQSLWVRLTGSCRNNTAPLIFLPRDRQSTGLFKSDLLAPGERITSCGVGRESTGKSSYSTYKQLDGTSMQQRMWLERLRVWGLLSVRGELMGKPEDVKQILLQTATDLQRTREIQGAGLLNLEKAITQKPARSRQPADKKKLGRAEQRRTDGYATEPELFVDPRSSYSLESG
jgi:serine protease AprX